MWGFLWLTPLLKTGTAVFDSYFTLVCVWSLQSFHPRFCRKCRKSVICPVRPHPISVSVSASYPSSKGWVSAADLCAQRDSPSLLRCAVEDCILVQSFLYCWRVLFSITTFKYCLVFNLAALLCKQQTCFKSPPTKTSHIVKNLDLFLLPPQPRMQNSGASAPQLQWKSAELLKLWSAAAAGCSVTS